MKVIAKRSRFINIFLGVMIIFIFGLSLIYTYSYELEITLLLIGIGMTLLGLTIIVYEFHIPKNYIMEDDRNLYVNKKVIQKRDIKHVYIKHIYQSKYICIELFSSKEVIKIGSIKKFNIVFDYLRSIVYMNIDSDNKKEELIY